MKNKRYDQYSQYRPVRFSSLTEDQIALLHEASLEIMERTGMRFYEPEAIALFRNAGAEIEDGNIVRIPPRLVEWALLRAPKNVTIYDQTGKRAMSLGGYRSYFGVGSDCMNIYDLDSGQRRQAVLADVVEGVRLVDSLPNLDFVMSMFLPSDVDDQRYERAQMAVMLQESQKPIVFVGLEASSTRYAHEMASIVAGGDAELKKYPFAINYVNTVSAFHHNQESIQRLLYAAERGMPTVYAPGNHRGLTGPMTLAGAIALGNAGQLAGLVLSQIKKEGSPFIRGDPAGFTTDMRTMVSLYAAPDVGPFSWNLAHHYGIPIFGTAGCSDAKVFDAQAAAEVALKLFENTIGGANLIHDIGYLDSAMTGSLELVAFCDEIIGWLRRYFSNLEINEDTLALDLIHKIGPDGQFLDSEHTLKHVREEWIPGIFDRLNYDRWETKGADSLQQRANQQVKEIVDSYKAEPLPVAVVAHLDEIVNRD